jgi:5'-3' exonuclease
MLLLIDAANLYFRAFHALPESITSPDGRPVNAIRGYLDMTAALIDKRRPDRYVACLDFDWRPAFRVKLVPSYKAHRRSADGGELVPDALVPQIPVLLEVLAALGLATAGAPGFEADDVIATIAARDSDRVEIVSGDRDLLALATGRVTVLYTGKGIAKMAAMGPAEVQQAYGIPAPNYADFAVLRGDPSDGLPGVPGVGEKTAAALVARFGAVEDIVAAAERGSDGFPSGAANKVLAAREYLTKAPAAVRGRTDAPVPELEDRLPAEPADPERLVELSEGLGIESSLNRVLIAIRAALGSGDRAPGPS